MKSLTHHLVAIGLVAVACALSCGTSGSGGTCTQGQGFQDCLCNQDGSCSAGLSCVSGICRAPADAGIGGALPGTGGGFSSGGRGNLGGNPSAGGFVAAGGFQAGGGRPTTCVGCTAGQVCVSGACVNVPNTCPCPRGSYCDLGTNQCSIGCVADEHCDTGQICDTAQRQCRVGCRDDVSCGPGLICESLNCHPGCRDNTACPPGQACVANVCVAGCRDGADCPMAGALCISGNCQCSAGQAVCGASCVDTDTDELNCGGCGAPCVGGTCSGGICTCAGGTSLCGTSCRADLGGSCTTSADCCDARHENCFMGECRRTYQQCAAPAPTDCGPSESCGIFVGGCTPTCDALGPNALCPGVVVQSGATRGGFCLFVECGLTCTSPSDCLVGQVCQTQATGPNGERFCAFP